jgi:hypothetical protein
MSFGRKCYQNDSLYVKKIENFVSLLVYQASLIWLPLLFPKELSHIRFKFSLANYFKTFVLWLQENWSQCKFLHHQDIVSLHHSLTDGVHVNRGRAFYVGSQAWSSLTTRVSAPTSCWTSWSCHTMGCSVSGRGTQVGSWTLPECCFPPQHMTQRACTTGHFGS